MEGDKQSSSLWSSLGGGSLIAMVLVALGFSVLPPPALLVAHPPAAASARAGNFAGSQIEARLWQDPLSFLAEPGVPDANQPELPGLDELAAVIARPPAGVTGPARVIVATLRPGGWAEAVESRRRTRVAVVAALFAEDYVAKDASHLRRLAHVAYEWYLPVAQRSEGAAGADGRPPLLVLWVPENALPPDPATALTALRTALAERGAGPAAKTPWPVLGPSDSGVLDALRNRLDADVRQAACRGALPQEPPDLHFFTGSATKPVDCGESDPGLGATANLGLFGTGVTRFTATDRELANALVLELARRGISPFRSDELMPTVADLLRGDPAPPDDALALVTEADTAYGRAMASTFCNSLVHAAGLELPPGKPCEETPDARQGFFHFTYLRGLNGELGVPGPQTPSAGGKPSASGSGDGGSRGDTAAAGPVLAEGNAQSDYLVRLAEQLVDLDHRLRSGAVVVPGARHAGARRGLRAVGLLGTDLYDKLMLLRALKPRLPDAVFFTTDLDARLLDDAQLPWTRNLVLASGAGLQAPDAGQAGFAGFRDTYQTTTFLATRIAVRRPEGQFSVAERACLDAVIGRVHVYEIGRRDLVEFSLPAAAAPCEGVPWAPLLLASEGEVPDGWTVRQRIGLSLSLLGLLLTGAFWTSRPLRNWIRTELGHGEAQDAAQRLRLSFGGLVMVVVLLAILIGWGGPLVVAYADASGEGQPFLWASGVSIWPPLLLIVPATALALWRALRVPQQLLDNLRAQHGWLGFSPDFDSTLAELRNGAEREPRGTRLLRDYLPMSMLRTLPGNLKPGQDSAARVPGFWRDYLRSGLGGARYRRLALITLMVGAVVMVLNDPIDNHLPLRGVHTAFVYTVANNCAMYTLLLMMAVVAESSLFCADFLEGLPDGESEWPAAVVARFAGELGVDAPLAVAWLQVRLAERRSAVVTPLIYLPFLFLSVMIVSHSNVFSPWHASSQQDVVIGCAGLVTVFCAWRLRSACEAVRSSSVARIEEALHVLLREHPAGSPKQEALQTLKTTIAEARGGALAPFGSQPWLRALLPPLLSFASSTALDLFGLR